jgi:hypothetical protein
MVSWTYTIDIDFLDKITTTLSNENSSNKSCTSWEVIQLCNWIFYLNNLLLVAHTNSWCESQCWRVPYVVRHHCAISAGGWQLRPPTLCPGHTDGRWLCPPAHSFSCASKNWFWHSVTVKIQCDVFKILLNGTNKTGVLVQFWRKISIIAWYRILLAAQTKRSRNIFVLILWLLSWSRGFDIRDFECLM